MALTLRVKSFQSQALGEHGTKRFGVEGGTIGRRQNNTWVLPDPERYVSGVHAEIVYRDGAYYLRDVSTNGTFVNGMPEPIGNGMEHRLADGDEIQIGDYDIVVSFDETGPSALTGPRGRELDPWGGSAALGDFTGPTGPRSLSEPPLSDAFGLSEPGHSTDVLSLFPEPETTEGRPSDGPSPIYRSSPDEWFYEPPQVDPPPAAQPSDPLYGRSPVIPEDEDWDLTSYEQSEHGWSGNGGFVGTNPFDHGQERVEHGNRAFPPPATPYAETPSYSEPPHPGDVPPYPGDAPPYPGDTPPYYGAADGGPLATMLMAAGLDPESARAAARSPELPSVLGAILGVVVQGMFEVLKARAEIKSQFRVPVTMMRAVENNPLKFSADARQALHTLLVARNPAYLGPIDAFKEGFEDLKAHQIAMIAGMHAAFDSMIKRFDPEELGRRFERKNSGLAGIVGKGRFWDMYTQLYKDWTQDADVNFQRLFGEKFALAYEEQMRKLTASGRPR